MSDYNKMPADSNRITNYEDFADFFIFNTSHEEFRQIPTHFGLVELKLYWINYTLNLGYAIGSNITKKEVLFYKIGTEENWKIFKENFAKEQY